MWTIDESPSQEPIKQSVARTIREESTQGERDLSVSSGRARDHCTWTTGMVDVTALEKGLELASWLEQATWSSEPEYADDVVGSAQRV